MLSELEIQEIKARHPLKEFLELRGLEFSKPSQGAFACTCPFHEEKTASFRVYPDHHFYCYGCGKVGDIFTILKDLDGLEFKDAVDRLNSTSPLTSAIRKATAPAKPDAVSIPLPESRLARWNASCERLAADPRQIERIASWRGLSKEIVVNAARAHLMGLWEYWGAIREAFLILAPGHCTRPVVEGVPPTYEPVPISIHVRLAPGSHGNQDGTKATWHYDPKSTQDTPVRSWPFIWGNLIGARWLFVLEGQWDGLALADACGWLTPESMPPGCVIVGLRGSTGSSRFLKDYPLDRKASAICIGDNDRAGNAWHDEGGFLDQLREKVARVICFQPQSGPHKDLNDLYKAGLFHGPEFLEMIREKLKAAPKRAKRETFLKWCRANSDREDALGRAARFVLRDKGRPKGRKNVRRWRQHWEHLQVSEDLFKDLEAALKAWNDTVPAPETIAEESPTDSTANTSIP